MNMDQTNEVPHLTLTEALEDRFVHWVKHHRIVPSGRHETGGNAADAEPYRFVAGRTIDPADRTYVVRGECRNTGRFFQFEVNPDGSVTNQASGDPFAAEIFRDWLIMSATNRRLEKARKAIAEPDKAAIVAKFEKDLRRTFGGHATAAAAEEHSRVMAISA